MQQDDSCRASHKAATHSSLSVISEIRAAAESSTRLLNIAKLLPPLILKREAPDHAGPMALAANVVVWNEKMVWSPITPC